MPSISITWHTAGDDQVCPICRAIDGYTWIFVAGQNVMTDALIHPVYGIVWSLEQGSEAHGHLGKQMNSCRCTIEPYIDCQDILAKCVYLKESLQGMADESQPSDVKKGSYRTTTLEDIGLTEEDLAGNE